MNFHIIKNNKANRQVVKLTTIVCDTCNESTHIQNTHQSELLTLSKIDGNNYNLWFKCPHCNDEYDITFFKI